MSEGNVLLLIVVFGILGVFAIMFVLPKYTFYKKKFALQRGGAKRLEVKWRGDHTQVIIILDAAKVGSLDFFSAEERQNGKSLALPDGSMLNVKMVINDDAKRFVTLIPDLTINGKPVPGSMNDPGHQLESASKDFYWGGAANVVFGLIFSLIEPDTVWYYILIVIPIGIAAFFVGFYLNRLSRTALSVGIALAILSVTTFLIGTMASLSTSTGNELCGNIFDLVDSYFFITGLIKGFKAIEYLENERKGVTIMDEKPKGDDFSERIEAGYGVEVVMCPNCKTVNSLSVVNCRTCQKDVSNEKPIRNPYL